MKPKGGGISGLIDSVLDDKEAVASAQNSPVKGDEPNNISRRLQGMEEAGARAKRPVFRLDPAKFTIWSGNAREYENLNEKKLASLIESIRADSGNTFPVIARRTANDDKPYEIIAGTRRHWAVAWLKANALPDITLLTAIEDLDDQEAFRIQEIENREREDVNDLERAHSYVLALESYFDGNKAEMARRIDVDRALLTRFIKLAEVPSDIIRAFNNRSDVTVRAMRPLFPLLSDADAVKKMIAAVGEIRSQNAFRLAEGHTPLSGPHIVGLLVKATKTETRGRRAKPPLVSAEGQPFGEIVQDRREGLVIKISPSGVARADIIETLATILADAKVFAHKDSD